MASLEQSQELMFKMSLEERKPQYLIINNKQLDINAYKPFVPTDAVSCPSRLD